MERQNNTLNRHLPATQFFGRRHGKKLKQSRIELMQKLLPRIVVQNPESILDIQKLFPFPIKDIWLEIGFGGGEHLSVQSFNHPDIGFLGAEPFMNGVASLLALLNGCHNGRVCETPLMLEKNRSDNVRIFPDDVRLLFPFLKNESLGRVFVLYPDPWPKKRHEARRFFMHENLVQLHRLLKDEGELRLATDVENYVTWGQNQIESSKLFTCVQKGVTPPHDWVSTRYEKKGVQAGRIPTYFIYTKNKLT